MASPALIRARFRDTFGRDAEVVASAPGRVNLIGEHTDYNDGFVLPMAIDRRTYVAIASREDDRIVAASSEFPGTQDVSRTSRGPGDARQWSDYIGAVAWALQPGAQRTRGFDVLVSSDVPVGAGLSSSAALELAVARALAASASHPWDAVSMAVLGQRAENEFVGVRCGIMDQMASAASRAGAAMLLDCRSLQTTFAVMPAALAVIVMDTGVRRALSGSEYNERRGACERAVAFIAAHQPKVRALRDVSREMLETYASRLDAATYSRALHVVDEIRRPAAMTRAFAANDLHAAGALLDESHASLRDLYEVSSAQLDIACEEARSHPACYGARLTGAGFGGCAIAFVERAHATEFIATVQPRYEARTYKQSSFFAVAPSEGARLD